MGYASLYVRKAPHSYGWDILPRLLTAGIWKPVSVREKKPEYIKEIFIYTKKVDIEAKEAFLQFYIDTEICGDFARDYSIKIKGSCGDSVFEPLTMGVVAKGEPEYRLWHSTQQLCIAVKNCKLWWPKNYGEQNLYDVTVDLLYKGEVIDSRSFKTGIRTLKLVRTDVTDNEGNGKFHFEVNGKKVFVMGTNWVPLDAIHSQDMKRLPKALELLDDIGCNMVRCWGGNVYESDEFFDFCDEHGIMVWQDFAMACAVYPQDDEFCKKLTEEAAFQIKRLRNHASLALWSGDNECDQANRWVAKDPDNDPNLNRLTRDVLKRAVFMHDPSRSFLPSSPYQSFEYIHGDGLSPENHLWGPRDYFKSDYYKNTFCHFASEIGYHGFASPDSTAKFLKNPQKIFEDDGYPTREYAAHSTGSDDGANGRFDCYAKRIRMAHDQVEVLFGKAEENFEDFVRQSQISQAEAKKFFIEMFRTGKGIRTGIIWWNLIDGWPQISDAVVDYYYTKKLAYSYIKRSQAPVCLMFDEPKDGEIQLVGVNDSLHKASVKYTVTDITNNKMIISGSVELGIDGAETLESVAVSETDHVMYLIEWETNGVKYKNHYYTNLKNIDYSSYKRDMEACGFDEWEGF